MLDIVLQEVTQEMAEEKGGDKGESAKKPAGGGLISQAGASPGGRVKGHNDESRDYIGFSKGEKDREKKPER